jgi:hypothetical protein
LLRFRDVPIFCHLYSLSCLDTPPPSGRACIHDARARAMTCYFPSARSWEFVMLASRKWWGKGGGSSGSCSRPTCSVVEIYWRFKEHNTSIFRVEESTEQATSQKHVASTIRQTINPTALRLFARSTYSSTSGWKQYSHVIRRSISTRLRGVASQKIAQLWKPRTSHVLLLFTLLIKLIEDSYKISIY